VSRRKTIAPVLSALLDDLVDTAKLPGDHQVLRLARADLSALLAVANAVRREGSPDCACGPCRAYARLRRLSESGGGAKPARRGGKP
jgi:hypothetical protein